MSIVTSLLKMMNGRIEVKSEPGKGSVFTVYIPQPKGTSGSRQKAKSLAGTGRLADIAPTEVKHANIKTSASSGSADPDDPKLTGAADQAQPSDNAGNADVASAPELKNTPVHKGFFQAPDARIIIVDDTRTNLFVATSLIKRTKVICETALSGREFLEKAASVKYDLILMDYRMPVMDGLETIKALRSSGGINADTPVIMMTAAAESDSIELFRENGITEILVKPINPAHYEALLASMLPPEKVNYLQ